jgi:hypothetical protein
MLVHLLSVCMTQEHMAQPDTLPAAALAPQPEKLVRTDHRSGTLDAFVTAPARAVALAGSVSRKRRAQERGEGPLVLDQMAAQAAVQRAVRPRRGPEVISQLSSIRELVAEVDSEAHEGLCEVMREHSFVGMVGGRLHVVQRLGGRTTIVYICILCCLLSHQGKDTIKARASWARGIRVCCSDDAWLETPPVKQFPQN